MCIKHSKIRKGFAAEASEKSSSIGASEEEQYRRNLGQLFQSALETGEVASFWEPGAIPALITFIRRSLFAKEDVENFVELQEDDDSRYGEDGEEEKNRAKNEDITEDTSGAGSGIVWGAWGEGNLGV